MTIKLRFTGISIVTNILWSLSFALMFVLIFGLKAKAFMEISIFGGIIIILGYLAINSTKLRTPRYVTFTNRNLLLVYGLTWGMGEYEIEIPKEEAIVVSSTGIAIKVNNNRYEITFYRNNHFTIEEGPERLFTLYNEVTTISSVPIYNRLADYKLAILEELQKMGYQVEGI